MTSNIWGTRFKISGLAPNLPSHLGQITYKTSLLHLQPRQMTLGVVDLRDPSGDLEEDVQLVCPSEDDEEDESKIDTKHPPIVPLSTPRLRRKGRRMPEPPPSPTHHRRPVQQQHQLVDEMLRIDWNGRVVLSTPAVRWRSLSAGHLANKESPAGRHRRKSRSLDSSPVINNRPLPGIRSSWAVQIRQPEKTHFRSRISGSQQQILADNNVKGSRFALARLSPLFGRKCPKATAGQRSEPNTPNSSPAVGRRRNNTSVCIERRQSPIRQLLNSPLLARRLGKNRSAAVPVCTDSSDDDDPQATTAHNFHDLESFQKAQLLNKVIGM